jgi:hypothetical protein
MPVSVTYAYFPSGENVKPCNESQHRANNPAVFLEGHTVGMIKSIRHDGHSAGVRVKPVDLVL